MPTLEEVEIWIQANLLDRKAWEDSTEKHIALTQSIRNLSRWYPDSALTDELVSCQVIWELQGLDPVLKYGKQGIKHISEDGDRIEFNTRDKVSPDVRDLLGPPSYELDTVTITLDGGQLL